MLACKGISTSRIIAAGNYIAVCGMLGKENRCVFSCFLNETFEYGDSGVA